jgi:hypothetical protein
MGLGRTIADPLRSMVQRAAVPILHRTEQETPYGQQPNAAFPNLSTRPI